MNGNGEFEKTSSLAGGTLDGSLASALSKAANKLSCTNGTEDRDVVHTITNAQMHKCTNGSYHVVRLTHSAVVKYEIGNVKRNLDLITCFRSQ